MGWQEEAPEGVLSGSLQEDNRLTSGLIHHYEGPFHILQKAGARAYKLESPLKIKHNSIYYVTLLKPYHGDQGSGRSP